MPPKRNAYVNEKARVALERKVERLRKIEEERKKAIEDAKWADEGSTIKEQRAAARAAKQAEKEARRREKKELYEAELAAAEKIKLAPSAKKAVRELNKVTQFAIMQAKLLEEKRLRELAEAKDREASRMLSLPEIQPNLNQINRDLVQEEEAKYGKGNVVHASGLDEVISALSISDQKEDKHPERRRKAAYKAFEEARMPTLRQDNPDLRYSQLKELLWKEWQNHPDNPMRE